MTRSESIPEPFGLESLLPPAPEALPAYPFPAQTLPEKSDQLHPSRTSRWGRRLGGSILAVSAALGLAGEWYADDPLLVPELTAGYFYDYGSEGVPDTIRQKVDNIIDRPANADLKALFGPDTANLSGEDSSRQYELFAMRKAREHGFTAIDPQPYRERLQEADSNEAVVGIVDEYTQQLGFGFKLHPKTDFKDIGSGATPLDETQLQTDKFKEGAKNLLGALVLAPKEVYTLADVKQIRAVQTLAEGHSGTIGTFKPAGKVNPATGIIYIPLSELYEGRYDLYMHEISHRIDYKINGAWGMYRDAGYVALNPSDFAYGDAHNPFLSRSTVRAYGGTNPSEDKATMSQGMINGLSSELLYNESPVIRSKYRMLLGRLEVRVPGVTEYLFAISGGTNLIEPVTCNSLTLDLTAEQPDC